MDLVQLRPPTPGAAAVAYGATPGDTLGGHVVGAVTVVLVAGALATATLGAAADANLVGDAGGSTARDEPTPAALVAAENVLGVQLEETEPSKMVGGKRLRL